MMPKLLLASPLGLPERDQIQTGAQQLVGQQDELSTEPRAIATQELVVYTALVAPV